MTSGLMLIAFLGPLALGAAVSPALVAASIGILGAFGERATRVLSLYLVGAAVPVGVALALGALPAIREPREVRNIQDVVDLLLAAVLIVVAIVAAVRHARRPGAAPRRRSFDDARWAGPGALGLGFGLGVAMMATNVSTMVLVLAAGRDLARTDAGTAWQVVGYAIVVIGALLPILAPLVWRLVSPRSAQRGVAAVERFLGRHGAPLTIAVCLATALYLIVRSTLVP